MTGRRDSLLPPEKTHTEDPGAHDLESEDEHFSDAQSAPSESMRSSPIPRTRVEKISNEPSYGEVPGTEAYRLREGDAEPDEIAIVTDDGSKLVEKDGVPATTHTPVPTTVLEEAEGGGAKTPEGKKHEADPMPDLVVKADGSLEVGSGETDETISPRALSPTISSSQRRLSSSSSRRAPSVAGSAQGDDDDDFDDDFDDFEDGGDNENAGDDDFGDFDDGFQAPGAAQAQPQEQPLPAQPPPQPAAAPSLSFPVPDFANLDQEDVLRTAAPYLNGLFLPDDEDAPPPPPLSNSLFLTPRSASLWSQLVAPPPLQPPDWIRSRIRRLFLVSLGVPVDLDEILPASKQKKLVLPSLSVRRDSPRTSSDSRGGANGSAQNNGSNVARLKQTDRNDSNTSVDSQGRPVPGLSRKRKGPPPVPDMDLVTARQLCTTTDEALDGMTDDELQSHLQKLQALELTAKEVLDYWTKKTDEKIGDREAFEGVIENLVAHARKTRK